ncbi:MAG TPA: DUF481 domain-containing protein [Candidatus Angelobacter sp.]|nr:DUF481 domain-containing protein [Candidatus Angelobacter sp.]
MRALYLPIVAAAIFSALMAKADHLVLTNGDRLSGTVVKLDGKKLLLKSDLAGEITLPWSAVQEITTEQPMHVGLSSGQSADGPISTRDGKLEIATRTRGAVVVPREDVALLRNPSEQSAYEQSLNPSVWENWESGTTLAFALTRGNSQSKNLALAFNADRKTLHDKFTLYANSVYATNDAPGAVPATTANAEQGGLRYDHDITPRMFGFGAADFQADALQTLNLRSVLGGGLGIHFIKRESTTLDLLGGGNYTHESYDAFTRNFAAITLGDEFMHKLRAATAITQSLYFYPDLSNTGEYRSTFNLGTVTKLSKWLGWQNSFGDIYVTNPPAGKKKNDVLFTTGLNIAFVRSGAK